MRRSRAPARGSSSSPLPRPRCLRHYARFAQQIDNRRDRFCRRLLHGRRALDVPQVRTCDRITRKRGGTPDLYASRDLQKRARLGRRDIAFGVAPRLAVECHVEHRLLVRGQQIVQPVDFGARVRQPTAFVHHRVERLAMRRGNCVQNGGNGLPELEPLRANNVASDLTANTRRERLRGCHFAIEHDVGRNSGIVEDANVLGQTDREKAGVHRRQRRSRARDACLEHDLEPLAESTGIELLVEAGSGRTPRIRSNTRASWPGVARVTSSAQSASPQCWITRCNTSGGNCGTARARCGADRMRSSRFSGWRGRG